MSLPNNSDSQRTPEWVLPAEIPFSDLKARDLEECVYWLLDAMGAKDLEWRTGGSGGGAADGGRDLEAKFYTPVADGELEAQRWWIECKGRAGTVDPDEVKSAINTTTAQESLDYLVIATNTQFSNPTRDWVATWQAKHAKPKVKLWDGATLERYLSRHPAVVLRLFSKALSLDGRFRAMEERFWNKLEFVSPQTLVDLWQGRKGLQLTGMGVIAAIANEFAHGSVSLRPWASALGSETLLEVLSVVCQNLIYLAIRCTDAGVDQGVIFRCVAYLTLGALDRLPAKRVHDVIMRSVARGELANMPEEAQDMLLTPFIGQLQAEIQDVCAEGCSRVSCFDRMTLPARADEIPDYWIRLEAVGLPRPEGRRTIRLEKLAEPCVVGFRVGKRKKCPLFAIQPSANSAGKILEVIQRVAAYRKAEAARIRTSK